MKGIYTYLYISIQYKCTINACWPNILLAFHVVPLYCRLVHCFKAFPERHRGNHGPCDVAACCVRRSRSRSDAEKRTKTSRRFSGKSTKDRCVPREQLGYYMSGSDLLSILSKQTAASLRTPKFCARQARLHKQAT